MVWVCITIKNITQQEKKEFLNERDDLSKRTGVTIIIPYSEDVHNTILENFKPDELIQRKMNERLDVVFGKCMPSNIKLIDKPLKNSLIVDDVYETGMTLSNFKNIEGANFFVLVSKKKPIWWNTAYLTHKKEWIIFPWENKNNKLEEENEYNIKRGLN